MEMENLIKLKKTLNKIYPISENFIVEIGKSYKITCFGSDQTSKKTLLVILNNEYILRLPNKYPNKITEKEITVYNTNSQRKLNVIYTGNTFIYYINFE